MEELISRMRIIECSPFFQENFIADIHIKESTKWVNEFHIIETNQTFQAKPKDYNFSLSHPKVYYHQVDAKHLFKKNRKIIPNININGSRSCPRFFRNSSWYNEAIQRNLAVKLAEIRDDDIVILSDIDEIIDPKYAEELITLTKKHGIITIPLRFTLFYFNLFSQNWSGPPDYTYRVFALTGKTLKTAYKFDSDWLRKLGERSKLLNSVHCPDHFFGFHHSWLGDETFISQKLAAYAHIEHREFNDKEYIRACVNEGKSIFPEHTLYSDPTIELLESVYHLKMQHPQLFWRHS